jgi:hypothetical protein
VLIPLNRVDLFYFEFAILFLTNNVENIVAVNQIVSDKDYFGGIAIFCYLIFLFVLRADRRYKNVDIFILTISPINHSYFFICSHAILLFESQICIHRSLFSYSNLNNILYMIEIYLN